MDTDFETDGIDAVGACVCVSLKCLSDRVARNDIPGRIMAARHGHVPLMDTTRD